MNNKPIIVLTPIKNEDWILNRFLSVTSKVADYIIIADQYSQDKSREIALGFDKVILIENPKEEYDEKFRQELLIGKAREIVPGPKILLALDADEILTANSIRHMDWTTIQKARPGTILYFEKPDLLFPLDNCIRHSNYFPLGYVDDGAPHNGKKIHSPRIPLRFSNPKLFINGIKIMHYALTRPNTYRARQRYYSMVENINRTKSLFNRLRYYSRKMALYGGHSKISPTPRSWFENLETDDIDMKSILENENSYFNHEVLKAIKQYGRMKFLLDDIWDFDWSKYNDEFYDVSPVNLKLSRVTRYFQRVAINLLIVSLRINDWLKG